MVVGEQPGDITDIRGRAFAGPAGKIVRAVLKELQIDLSGVYFTYALKHFSFSMIGKRRLPVKPTANDINSCRSWLLEEIAIINPALIVALGASVAESVLGKATLHNAERGTLHTYGAHSTVLITTEVEQVQKKHYGSKYHSQREYLRTDLTMALQQVYSTRQVPLFY